MIVQGKYFRYRIDLIKASFIAGCLILLCACQTPVHTQQLLENPPNIVKQHLIENVPFYPQQDYFCGPTTLSEVANFYNIKQTPQNIAPNTFIPALEGTLQIEMVAAARQIGLVAYSQRGNLEQLLRLVSEDIPVIVLQNNGIQLLPQWHYAVVIGYDINAEEVILHTGVTPKHRLNFSTFERTWQRGNYWILALLPPGKTSQQLDPFIYTKACQDLLDTNQVELGINALKNSINQWPENWLAYFLLANHYLEHSPHTALTWFGKGFKYANNQVEYLNNYAYTLGKVGCYTQAINMINMAVNLAPEDLNVLDTWQTLLEDSQQSSASVANYQCGKTIKMVNNIN